MHSLLTTKLGLKSFQTTFVLIVLSVILANVSPVVCAPSDDTHFDVIEDVCVHTLQRPSTFFKRHFNTSFLKKFFKHWVPFVSADGVKMKFYLYKRDFPECGREIRMDDEESVLSSGFNAEHQTRFIIHGWMSQSVGKFNRAVKNAYMKLAKADIFPDFINDSDESNSTASNDSIPLFSADDGDGEEEIREKRGVSHNASNDWNQDTANNNITDFNVILVDWSLISSNINYFGVVEVIEDLGTLLAEFLRFLNLKAHMYFGDVYLIGHSLGAQIAGSAGKQVHPFRINTIFALDPAGPKFRDFSDDKRLDPSDAEYVESIQTSSSLGFEEPVGHATFYPNFGKDQEKCYKFGCSHSRSHKYFAESITSEEGFWGTLGQRQSDNVWILSTSGVEFKMGGEPSTPKRGTFYVKTNAQPPYAMGKRKPDEPMEELGGNINKI